MSKLEKGLRQQQQQAAAAEAVEVGSVEEKQAMSLQGFQRRGMTCAVNATLAMLEHVGERRRLPECEMSALKTCLRLAAGGMYWGEVIFALIRSDQRCREAFTVEEKAHWKAVREAIDVGTNHRR